MEICKGNSEPFLVFAVDPGITNVGVFHAAVLGLNVTDILLCRQVNTTALVCTSGCGDGGHDPAGSVYPYAVAFCAAFGRELSAANIILVERQPVGSAGMALDIVLQERWPSKIILIPPEKLHAHFQTRGMPYESRKRAAVQTCLRALEKWTLDSVGGALVALEKFKQGETAMETRQHDSADACLLLLYYLNRARGKVSCSSSITTPVDPSPFQVFVEKFRYHASPSKPMIFDAVKMPRERDPCTTSTIKRA